MTTTFYRFVYARTRQIKRGDRCLVLITPKLGGESRTFRPEEFELATLFDGERTVEEVMDAHYKRSGLRLTRDHVERFVAGLCEVGIMQKREVSPAAVRLPDEAARSSTGGARRAESDPRSSAQHGADDVDIDPDFEHAAPEGGARAAAGSGHETLPPLEGEVVDPPLWDSGESRHAGARASAPPAARPRAAPGGRKGPRILIPIPVRWLLPIGSISNLLLASGWLVLISISLGLLAVYGIWVNRAEAFRDLGRLFVPLSLAHTLLISMFTVNLIGQLARAAAIRKVTGRVPPFGVALIMSVLPRFFTDMSDMARIRDARARMRVVASSMNASLLLFVAMAFAWFMTKNTATVLPLFYLGVGFIAGFICLLGLNPFSRREGYLVLTAFFKVPDLRERAFASLLGRSPPPRPGRRSISPWALRAYGLLVVAYLGLIGTLVVMAIGGWLEARWGGLGVLIFLALVALVLSDPLQASAGQSRALVTRPNTSAASASRGRRPSARARRRRPVVRSRFIALLLVAVLLYLGTLPYTFEPGGDFVILPARRVDVRAFIAGDIRAIHVKEGDTVKAGQLLVQLAEDEERKNLAVSEAKLAELRAELAIAEIGATAEQIAVTEQRVATARTKAEFSRERAKRLKQLIKRKVVSQQDFEDALATAEVDAAKLREAIGDLDLLRSGTRPEAIDAIKASIAKETAQLDYSRSQLEYTEVRAAIDGEVVSGSLQFAVGDYLEKGEQIAAIEATRTVQAEIKIPQADISEVRLGAPVRIKAWAHSDREFPGTVRNIAPTAENSDYGKVVRVLTDIDNEAGALRSELTGYAKIQGETMPAAFAFTRMLRRFLEVELWSWLP